MATIPFLDSYLPADLKKMQGWAKAGRPDRILKEMVERRRLYAPTSAPNECLGEAFDQAGRQSPEHLIALSFQAMFATSYGVVVRLQYLLKIYLCECDQGGNSFEVWEYIAARILPLIERGNQQMLKLTKEYTAARRWLDLPEWTDIATAQDEPPPEGPPDEPADAADTAPQEPPQEAPPVQATDEVAETQPGA